MAFQHCCLRTARKSPQFLLQFYGKQDLMLTLSLKRSIITPIYKGGGESNYRPIALKSHLVKLLEKVLRKHLIKHVNSNNQFNLPMEYKRAWYRRDHSKVARIISCQKDIKLSLLMVSSQSRKNSMQFNGPSFTRSVELKMMTTGPASRK